jgi:hypothetical protein
MLRIYLTGGHVWRDGRALATRLWYRQPAALMVSYLVVATAAELLGQSADMAKQTIGVEAVPVLALLSWRVTRGGWVSRGLLIYYVSARQLIGAAGLGGQWWHIQPAAVSALALAGLLLLLSPAVYARTHPGRPSATSRMRLRPSRWLVVAAPLTGTAAAGLALAVTRRWYQPGPGCMTGPVEGMPPRCVGVGQGFPVPVAATVHGSHTLSQLAFVQDCVQWTVMILTGSYLLWLAFHRRSATERHLGTDLAAASAAS